MSPQARIQAAVASVLVLCFAAATVSAHPVPQPKDIEKCYGVSLGVNGPGTLAFHRWLER